MRAIENRSALATVALATAFHLACGGSTPGRAEGGVGGQSGGGTGGWSTGGAGPAACPYDGGAAAPVTWPPTTALRPIAPLSTAPVTSQRPTFHWALGTGADGARVQICRDRACRGEVATFDATGSSGAPRTPLSKGVYFWHARALAGGTALDGWTPIWQFIVGARTTPLDTSWGTTLDVNGDGFADVIVGAAQAAGGTGRAYLYLGSSCGLDSSPRLIDADSEAGAFGLFVASAGDVNGDGFGDVVVDGLGRANVYLGGPAGLAPSPLVTLRSPEGGTRTPNLFGIHASSAGDVNGDGFGDLVVGDNSVERAYLYLGSAAGPVSPPATSLTDLPPGSPGSNSDFGHSVAGAGDVNGDGFADVVIGANGAAQLAGAVYLYLGSAAGLGSSPAAVLAGPDGASGSFGAVSSAGDVNGDGFADVVVGANAVGGDYAGRAYVYLGGANGLVPTASVTLSGTIAGGSFGRYVSDAGDVNGDGYGDIVVGADGEGIAAGILSAEVDPGWAFIYLGSAGGISDAPAVTLTGPEAFGGYFGRSVAAASDVNGDGYGDVVVGADAGGIEVGARDAGMDDTIGWAHLYLGGASGVLPSPSVTLPGPEPGSLFGRIVAMVRRLTPRRLALVAL